MLVFERFGKAARGRAHPAYTGDQYSENHPPGSSGTSGTSRGMRLSHGRLDAPAWTGGPCSKSGAVVGSSSTICAAVVSTALAAILRLLLSRIISVVSCLTKPISPIYLLGNAAASAASCSAT